MALKFFERLIQLKWLIPIIAAQLPSEEHHQSCLSRFTNPVKMSHCNITGLKPDHFPSDLLITTLDMSYNPWFDFPSNGTSFLVHEHLLHYYCKHCGITAIYSNTFGGLTKLKTLDLEGNCIKAIPSDAFNRNQLHYLMIEGNEIEQFNDENRLETMQHLVMLFASGNVNFKLNELNMDFARLEWIRCNQCGLTILDKQWLRQGIRLKKLNLEDNRIVTIPRDTFSQNSRLCYLNLNGNPLEWLEIISDSLEILSCVGCNLVQLSSFHTLPRLIQLDLQSNNISSIESTAFALNNHLERVNLDDNNLETISENIILNRRLHILCIDNNPLQACPELLNFKQLYKALRLRKDCSSGNNTLNHFEHIIPDHPLNGVSYNKKNLPPCNESLDLSNRNVAFVYPSSYENCSSLSHLTMNDNSNYSFPHNHPFLHSKSLHAFSCIRCGIHALYDHTFSKLPSLRSLDLSENHIRKISSFDIFLPNPILQQLSLEFNGLTNFSIQLLSSHSKLISLNLSHNPTLYLSPDLPLLEQPSVAKFEASFCRIPEISQHSFRLTPALEEVDISNNPIVQIHPKAFERNGKLRILDVSHTHLTKLDPATFEGMLQLRRVHLHGLHRYDFESDLENSRALWELLASRNLYGNEGKDFLARLEAGIKDWDEMNALNQRKESNANACVKTLSNIGLILTGFIIIWNC